MRHYGYEETGSRYFDVSLDVRTGEVLGLAGVEGQGQRSFLRALTGSRPQPTSG